VTRAIVKQERMDRSPFSRNDYCVRKDIVSIWSIRVALRRKPAKTQVGENRYQRRVCSWWAGNGVARERVENNR
jgi:hypothetical protein